MNKNQIEPDHTQIEWTLFSAAREFGIHRATLEKRLAAAGEQPFGKGKYRTKQIVAAIFTEDRDERVRLIREQADRLELENAATREAFAPVEEVQKVFSAWVAVCRKFIAESDLPAEAKENILAACRDIDPEEYFRTDDAPFDDEFGGRNR